MTEPLAFANGDEAAALAADWLTIWQSEWAALAADPEVQEAQQRAAAAASHSMKAQPTQAGPDDGAGGSPPTPQDPGARLQAAYIQAAVDAATRWARPPPAPWPTAIIDAPDARDAAVAQLLDRIARLDRCATADPPLR